MIHRIDLDGHPTAAVAARRSPVSDLWHLIDDTGNTVDVVDSTEMTAILRAETIAEIEAAILPDR